MKASGHRNSLPDSFRHHLSSLCPEWARCRFLVAYSGGLDSTALLHLAARILPPESLGAAHLNHLLRGEAAGRDQRFAEETVRNLGLAFLTEDREVAELARSRRKGLEEAARRARYEFLDRAAANFQANFVLTAHQADDQAETMLLNLVKGAGPGGLAGIHPRRPLRRPEPGQTTRSRPVELLRPLLSFTRSELKQWLTDQNLNWVEDISNEDTRHRRNLIRREILPALCGLNPRLVPALARTAEVLRGEEDFWQIHLRGLWAKTVVKEEPATLNLDRLALAGLSPAEQRRLIYEALQHIWLSRPNPPEPLTFAAVEEVLALLESAKPRGLDLPGGLRAEVKTGKLYLSLASRLLKSIETDAL